LTLADVWRTVFDINNGMDHAVKRTSPVDISNWKNSPPKAAALMSGDIDPGAAAILLMRQ